MHHLAILSKASGLFDKILSGEKTIESRWYKFPRTPYQNISVDDTVYFKESSAPVTARAQVSKVLFYEGLDQNKIIKILSEYGPQIGVPLSYADRLKGKNYCTLIFLEEIEAIPPFQIDKTGYGNMIAWITVEDVERIKKE